MVECLLSDKVCSNTNKKCKECILDDCKKTLLAIEEEEKMYYLTKEEVLNGKIKREYPECANCPFLEKRGTNEVYCFYRSKDECLLKNK